MVVVVVVAAAAAAAAAVVVVVSSLVAGAVLMAALLVVGSRSLKFLLPLISFKGFIKVPLKFQLFPLITDIVTGSGPAYPRPMSLNFKGPQTGLQKKDFREPKCIPCSFLWGYVPTLFGL